jgi:hypothetical protein
MHTKTSSIYKMSITGRTILPLLLLKVMYFEAMMANVVTKMLSFMIVSFITVCAIIVATEECSHFCDNIEMTIMIVQIYLLFCIRALVYNGAKVFL